MTSKMLDVLDTTKYVVDKSSLVKINKSGINKLTSAVTPDDLKISELELAGQKRDKEFLIQITFIFNTINYCFWAKPNEEKWTTDINGEKLGGAIALYRALENEVKSNPGFIHADYLESLSVEELGIILSGNVEIPLLGERIECLNEAGAVLKTKFDGSFIEVYNQANGDAYKMADLLVSNFSKFDDKSSYKGKTAGFYKRAQLNSKMISDLCMAYGDKSLENLDQLTAFADYKIPQKLRNIGILEYESELAYKIDNYILIEPNSNEEIEIRATAIWAVELIKQELLEKYDFVTSSHVDSMLWNMSQTKKAGEKPYHRTFTIFY